MTFRNDPIGKGSPRFFSWGRNPPLVCTSLEGNRAETLQPVRPPTFKTKKNMPPAPSLWLLLSQAKEELVMDIYRTQSGWAWESTASCHLKSSKSLQSEIISCHSNFSLSAPGPRDWLIFSFPQPLFISNQGFFSLL